MGAAGPVTTPSRVLMDTSVVISPPRAGMTSLADLLAVSAVTLAELIYGVAATDDPIERRRRRRRTLSVSEKFAVLPFDTAAAESYGLLANAVRTAGRNPRPRRLDLMIAATAESHGLSLATRNAADFAHLGGLVHIVDVR